MPCSEWAEPRAAPGWIAGSWATAATRSKDNQISRRHSPAWVLSVFWAGAETQIKAMTEAIGPLNAAGQCNEGFVRDDAILVVTIITDEEDGEEATAGDPACWKQAVLQAKNDDEGAIVVLALIGDTDVPMALCTEYDPDVGTGAEASPNLRTFAESFEFGEWGSVCSTDYAPFFEEAVSVIDTACEEFIPPE